MLMNRHFTLLRFHLISSHPRAYLSGRRDGGEPFVVEMSRSHSETWIAEVPLAEGTYRMRYYCGNERHLTYYGPAAINGSRLDGLDAVVVVHAPVAMTAEASID